MTIEELIFKGKELQNTIYQSKEFRGYISYSSNKEEEYQNWLYSVKRIIQNIGALLKDLNPMSKIYLPKIILKY